MGRIGVDLTCQWDASSPWQCSEARCSVTGRFAGFGLVFNVLKGPEDRCFVALSAFCFYGNE